jgi:hypothetical protein
MNMNKIIITLIVILFFVFDSKGQTTDLINNDSLVFIRNFNKRALTVLQNKDRYAKYKYNYYIDGIKSDSTNTPIEFNFYNKIDGDFYFFQKTGEEYVYYRISESGVLTEYLKTKTRYFGITGDLMIGVDQISYENVEEKENYGNVSGGLKPKDQLLRKIVSYNAITRVKSDLFNLDNIEIPKEEDIINIFFFTDQGKLLITTGIYESGSQSVNNVFVYEIESGKISKKLPNLLNDFDRKYSASYFSWSLNYFVGYDVIQSHLFINDYILDRNFNVTGFSLKKYKGFLPLFLEQGKDYFLTSSILDNPKKSLKMSFNKVLLVYKVSVELEMAFYKIFNEKVIDKAELSKFDQNDLFLLKNMVYAKHNYQFESEYYQAFFNLFDFYNSAKKRRVRIKNIEGLLSENDKNNLEAITKKIKNKGIFKL